MSIWLKKSKPLGPTLTTGLKIWMLGTSFGVVQGEMVGDM